MKRYIVEYWLRSESMTHAKNKKEARKNILFFNNKYNTKIISIKEE